MLSVFAVSLADGSQPLPWLRQPLTLLLQQLLADLWLWRLWQPLEELRLCQLRQPLEEHWLWRLWHLPQLLESMWQLLVELWLSQLWQPLVYLWLGQQLGQLWVHISV